VQPPIKVRIGSEKGVKAYVCSKARPIVGVNEVRVITMDNINVTSHESHLESQNDRIIAVLGQDETDCIPICNPHKALPKQHVTVLVNSPVAGKPLSQVNASGLHSRDIVRNQKQLGKRRRKSPLS
jgi:hypothetical protein